MADYTGLVVRPDEKTLLVRAGGAIDIESGGVIDIKSGGKLTLGAAGGLEIVGDFVKGERFQVSYPNLAPTNVGVAFFIAPAPCKIISAYEIHGTACDAADTLTIEKCTPGEDAGAGDVLLTAPFTINSTVNTAVTKTAVTTAVASLAAGDALMLKFVAGDGTDYKEGCVTCTMEWL